MTGRILAFGDSLTWGLNPGEGQHRYEDRWTSVVEEMVPGLHVIVEGLPGRTTCFDDWAEDGTDRNGARVLPSILGACQRLDLVILLLGTNDLKPDLCGHAEGAASGIERLITIIAGFSYVDVAVPPKILVVSPPLCGPSIKGDGLPSRGRSIEQSGKLASCYRTVAERHGCAFFDAATVANPSPIDGVHLGAEDTKAIGRGLAPIVRELLLLA
ncbi:SGNH/GDSL hydrolase family protein [Neorhizobium alkalisoli]|uniref:Lysophospholipase L1-like esterase n=1 Tax=Neorhizobium alkalisoli TaxID=528178 RepID=A0A561R6N5_9HYPH|nr:SGNH/GDSL hydrolase family protein [Neorhizobium alkalisoli]TWF58269.1 lysophospholipase L1-like esterase [Neorhizobium alkalisoli]